MKMRYQQTVFHTFCQTHCRNIKHMQKIFFPQSHPGELFQISFDFNKMIYLHVPFLYCVAQSCFFFQQRFQKSWNVFLSLNKSNQTVLPTKAIQCAWVHIVTSFIPSCFTKRWTFSHPLLKNNWTFCEFLIMQLSLVINEPVYLWNVRGCAL